MPWVFTAWRWIDLDLAVSLQGAHDGSDETLAVETMGTGSGWKQSK